MRRRGVCERVLKHRSVREGLAMNKRLLTGRQPDSGKPTVRDRREACGNVVMMGAGLRPIGKPMDQPPYPNIMRAPHFYPDSFPARVRHAEQKGGFRSDGRIDARQPVFNPTGRFNPMPPRFIAGPDSGPSVPPSPNFF